MSMGICLCLGNLLLIYYVKKVKQFFSSSLKSSIATVISLIISFGVFQEFSGAEEYPYVITSICLVGFLIIIGVFITSFMLSPKEKRGAIFNENSAIELVNTRSILKYKIFLIIVITLSAVLFQAGFCFPKILMHFQTNYTITQNVSLLFPAVLGQILCICLLLPILKLVKSYNPPPFALS
jgi:hypothetical protein